MGTGFNWVIVLYAGVGVGVFLIGVGVLVAMIALAKTFGRLTVTLESVDRQIDAVGKPVSDTLTHVNGIADTADATIARLSGVVGSLEEVAGAFAETTDTMKKAVVPGIVNVGSTITGITAGLRRLVNGRNHE